MSNIPDDTGNTLVNGEANPDWPRVCAELETEEAARRATIVPAAPPKAAGVDPRVDYRLLDAEICFIDGNVSVVALARALLTEGLRLVSRDRDLWIEKVP